MILRKMKVKNFRLLKDFELEFKDELSLVIGKNNCGKTSALIILDKMLNSSKIMWEDINLECQKEFYGKIISSDLSCVILFASTSNLLEYFFISKKFTKFLLINLENDLKSSIFFSLIIFFNSMIFFAAINKINSNTIMLFSGFKSIMNF